MFARLKPSLIWSAKAVTGCGLAAVSLSTFVITDDRLEKLSPFLPKLLTAHAFATPDHGLHPGHYPW